MCEFVSWIEKNGTLWYLTDADLQSPRGKEYRDYNPNRDDDRGHGAIRWFYNLEGGQDRECTDFSAPDNFPAEIAEAIKHGKFARWFGSVPKGILIAPLYADYEAKRTSLYADYEAKRTSLDADYEAKRTSLDYQTWLMVTESKNRAKKWR